LSELAVLLGGRLAGHIKPGRGGRLMWTYDDAYRRASDPTALSLSLPLVAREHRGPEVEAFLWGLLPDSERILDGLARRFHVSSGSLLGLLRHVGEECAGAVQLVVPERVEAIVRPGPDEIQWIDESNVAARLRALRVDPSASRAETDSGQLSLAGAQPKTALLFRKGRWGVPSGRTPTTHILKPPMIGLEGHVENEHACLSLAAELGLPAARTEVRWFEDECAIVVERFDRAREDGGRIRRLHQEDLCQALGVHPARKYENEGGPGASRIVALLRDHSQRTERDIRAFVDALVLSWLIGGTDAHAKNYGLLHDSHGLVRLAPLYDVASILPYGDRFDPRRAKLAMKIGGEYRVRDIGTAEWRKLAKELRLDADDLIERIRVMARDVAPRFSAVRDRMRDEGLDHEILDRLAKALAKRAKECLRG
jgi:serine/threonine-protein kinase HipA